MPFPVQSEVGSVPGFSADHILQSDLFMYPPSGGNLTTLAGLETIQRNFLSARAASALSPVHYRAQYAGGFGSVLPPASSTKQALI